MKGTVDGKKIRRENQLGFIVYPIIYRDLYIHPRGVSRLNSEPLTVGISRID